MDLYIIKIGGAILDQPDRLQPFLAQFAAIADEKILVHGGGKTATEIAGRLGIQPQFVDGRRITGADMLQVAVMVYGGLINRQLVAHLRALGCTAIGLAGADAGLFHAHKRTGTAIDYGFVGDIDRVEASRLLHILQAGWVPVLAPLTCNDAGQLLNTNADTIAAEIAVAMSAIRRTTLIYCFDRPGVLVEKDAGQVPVTALNEQEYGRLTAEGAIRDGMIPKLDRGFHALKHGASRVVLCQAEHLEQVIQGRLCGTTLER